VFIRQLSLSLIIVVIASIVSFGWIINQVYLHISEPISAKQEHKNYLIYTRALVNALNASEEKHAFIREWNTQNSLLMHIIERDNFPLPETLTDDLERGDPIVLESNKGATVFYLLPSRSEILSIRLPSLGVDPSKNRLEFILTLSFYAGVTTIILIWMWPLIHYLGKLRDTARRFGQGELDARMPHHKLSYIKDIEVEFNHMADRIQSLISDNKLLSRAVSHDLKTPLARLRFGLDALTETQNSQLKEKYAQRVSRDLEDMEVLVDTLLQYARLDESHIDLKQRPINPASIIDAICQTFDDDDIDIEFNKLTSPLIEISADKRYFVMMLNNVISNAVQHATSKVLISLTHCSGGYALTIEDDGNGIAADERNHVTKPFWRGTQSREKKGHGMGLAIVARIAEWHGANLDIDTSDTLGGAKIMLSFTQSPN